MMFHALQYPFNGSDIVSDLIYVGYLAFMWGAVGMAAYLDIKATPSLSSITT
jgi:hypothetical protein